MKENKELKEILSTTTQIKALAMDKDKPSLNLYQRIAKAREYVANMQTPKQGVNSFAKYRYFTPDQVDAIATEAELISGIVTNFSLKIDYKDNLFGELIITNIDNLNEKIVVSNQTALAEIKGANKAQQYGGTVTYTRRYMLQNLFRINSEKVDIDSIEPKQKPSFDLNNKTRLKNEISKQEFERRFNK